ncbi:MAG: hypothetical protein Q9216_006976, partial [Gyalolechia sp. 2 TL-2023]
NEEACRTTAAYAYAFHRPYKGRFKILLAGAGDGEQQEVASVSYRAWRPASGANTRSKAAQKVGKEEEQEEAGKETHYQPGGRGDFDIQLASQAPGVWVDRAVPKGRASAAGAGAGEKKKDKDGGQGEGESEEEDVDERTFLQKKFHIFECVTRELSGMKASLTTVADVKVDYTLKYEQEKNIQHCIFITTKEDRYCWASIAMEGLEIFVSDVKKGTSSTDLKRFLAPLLKPFSILVFEVRIHRLKSEAAKTTATLTTHKAIEGDNFLRRYAKLRVPLRELQFNGFQLAFRRSKFEPNELLVRVLRREEKELILEGYDPSGVEIPFTHGDSPHREYLVSSVACGNWEYIGPQPHYRPYYETSVDATATFGDRCFVINYSTDRGADDQSFEALNYTSLEVQQCESSVVLYEVQFQYSSLTSIVIDPKADPSIICTVSEGPKIWANRIRCIGLQGLPIEVSTSCQVYRLRLANAADISNLLYLERTKAFPQCTILRVKDVYFDLPFVDQIRKLKQEMEASRHNLSFAVKFQVQKLAQNGYLPPRVVMTLIDYISLTQTRSGPATTVAALRRLFQQLPYAGPSTKAGDLDTRAIVDLLNSNIGRVTEEYEYQSAEKSSSVMTIYKADVTPTGIFLTGPDPESSNRVLRKYADHSDHFLRVTFTDEDGEVFYFDRFKSNRVVFHERFAHILRDGIEVGGRLYEFLGFSHSSLRAQTCWFLAPFSSLDQYVNADLIISNLGDFSHIQCPAKCAARIGQAFTETSSSIPLESGCVEEVDDVERNGRVFSDGATQKSSLLPATVFQIRYAGAKGMISLDDRLHGDVLRLRPSMIKYRGAKDSKIEICGVASKMLPLVLNRQLIKILEDLGVPNGVFEDLQASAIEELRMSVSSITNAASFLEKHDVGLATQTTWLLRKMGSLGLALSDDMFFRDLLDAVVLVQLQQLKHRSRIPVKEGATLYGIMDETGVLAEGEVFCTYVDGQGRLNHAKGPVVVARSPALHPGDIQIAVAVTVPEDCPLVALHNCIVFSSKGSRDLPSQLAGGDLDGDLYHVIWDPKLIPPRPHRPASYPRVPPLDVGRPIARQDMSDFFVQFMEQDQLGRVATQHQILADQYERGTLHKDCIKLAELHSTAVDFSKTGIPIAEDQLPRSCHVATQYRPDFMAPGRRVKVEKHGIIFEATAIDMLENDNPRRVGQPRRKRYYESNKILGILYRSIDERAFFQDLHERSAVIKDDNKPSAGVLADLWEYIKDETVGLEWYRYVGAALGMREMYEAEVYDIILQYSTHPTEHLEEIEVFIGNIICRSGGYRSKRQKEYTTAMKEKYDRGVSLLIASMRMRHEGDSVRAGEEEEEEEEEEKQEYETLRQSMAC